MPQFATLHALEDELNAMGDLTAEYWDKQVHTVPKSSVVDRNGFLVKMCTGKTILHVGCTGVLDQQLRKVTTRCYGIDKDPQGRPDAIALDLDKPCDLGLGTWADVGVELIVCGEVLEHLSNPGNFLDSLKTNYPDVPVIFTVPNAHSSAGQTWLVNRGRENVNHDHVCYYSYTTLKELLRRAGYAITKHYWYGGKVYTSEGLIALVRPL